MFSYGISPKMKNSPLKKKIQKNKKTVFELMW